MCSSALKTVALRLLQPAVTPLLCRASGSSSKAMTAVPGGAERGTESSLSPDHPAEWGCFCRRTLSPHSFGCSPLSPCQTTSGSQYVNATGSPHLRPNVAGVLQRQEIRGESRGQGVGFFLFFPAPLTRHSLRWDFHLTLQGEQSGRGADWKKERKCLPHSYVLP